MIEFLKTEKLIYLPIYYYIDDNSKKKINGIWSDETPLSNDESASITEAYSIYLKHTEKLYCVDVDEPVSHGADFFPSIFVRHLCVFSHHEKWISYSIIDMSLISG